MDRDDLDDDDDASEGGKVKVWALVLINSFWDDDEEGGLGLGLGLGLIRQFLRYLLRLIGELK